ncbi:transmembrane protein 255B isoform X1 [Dipodomys spectabilis]|uniref:transmembrane protein 255B isoform X1 n=1 Tax=Dipodomys spectabilis TaxID=105255 RepID=UPI001C539ED5|nr:transmembrane protein 255B isoform X1 [Dipodomys spectabilis]
MQPLPPPVPGPLALLDTTGLGENRKQETCCRPSFQLALVLYQEVARFFLNSRGQGTLQKRKDKEGFARRKKISLWFLGSLLLVSALILTVGLAANTRTENVTVGGYYPGIILGFGAFLGLTGVNLVENRRQMLVAAIVFISFGVVAAFCCAIVDGVFAARHIEPRPLSTGRCQFYSSGTGYLYDVYETEVTCYSLNGRCQLKVRSNTCYCCDLYACGSSEHSPAYYEFVGVRGCQDVVHLYRLLWVSTALNILGLCTGILTAAVLGAFKDMVPLSQLAYGPSPPPQILYNPAQQILTYTGFCPPPSTVPTCSSYPLPLQPSGALPASASAGLSLPEDVWPPGQGQPPHATPLCTPACFLPGEKPPPYAP